MADLLEQRFEFPAPQIRILRNEEATRREILEALEGLAHRATSETVLVIHWSGHGSQIADREGDEPDGLDETLVPYDARNDGVCDITDDELLVYLSCLRAKGAFVTVIIDACHSGHLYRDRRFGRVRQIPADTRPASELPPSPILGRHHTRRSGESGYRGWLRRQERQVLLGACRDDQEAFERPLFAGEAHGEWTFALLRVLRDSPRDSTSRQIFDRARHRLLQADVPQWPQLVGARDQLIFGVEARPPVRFVEVREHSATRVELSGGSAHGLVEGSLWDIHARGTYEPSPGDALGRVRLLTVKALSSAGEIQDPTPLVESPVPRIETGDWAFEVLPAYGELRLGVRVLGPPTFEPERELEQRIRKSPVLLEAAPGEEDCVSVEVGDSQYRLLDAHGLSLDDPFPRSDPKSLENIIDRLERRARWRHGLRLENRDPHSRVASSLQAIVLVRDPSGDWGPASDSHQFSPSDLFAIEVRHTFSADLYIYILDFGLTDSVTQLSPPPGGEECLPPGTTIRLGALDGDEFELWLPDDLARRDDLIGFLKLFATTQPTDFSWLRTDVRFPSTYRTGPTSLSRLLAMGGPGPVLRQGREDWGTVLMPMRFSRQLTQSCS